MGLITWCVLLCEYTYARLLKGVVLEVREWCPLSREVERPKLLRLKRSCMQCAGRPERYSEEDKIYPGEHAGQIRCKREYYLPREKTRL